MKAGTSHLKKGSGTLITWDVPSDYLKCPNFNKNYKTCKETNKYGPYTGEKNSQ